MKKYKLTGKTLVSSEILDLIEWLKGGHQLTKANLTVELEKEFASYIGTKYSVFVNSGSSANLLAVNVAKIYWGAKNIAVPVVSWATDYAPVVQLGLNPVLVDCNMEDLSIDINKFEKLCIDGKIDTLILVSVLGMIPSMSRIRDICYEFNINLIEDCCESLGSEYCGKKLGSFGEISTFSSYFAHHITTIEGGFICTDSKEIYDILLATRSHGWARELSRDSKLLTDIEDPITPFTFLIPGFNVRNNEIGAFLGLSQLKRFSSGNDVEHREEIYNIYREQIRNNMLLLRHTSEDSKVSNFAFPVVFKNTSTQEAIRFLKTKQIECRPIIAGSLELQPMFNRKGDIVCKNAEKVHNCGIYLPNNSNITRYDVNYISSKVNELN